MFRGAQQADQAIGIVECVVLGQQQDAGGQYTTMHAT